MSTVPKLAIWIFLINILKSSRSSSDVKISPDILRVLEGNSATVTCHYSGNSTLQGASFKINTNDVVATITLPNCTYNTVESIVLTDCENNHTFTATWKDVSRKDNEKRVVCEIIPFGVRLKSENEALFQVIVPVENIFITSNDVVNATISICENSTTSLTCETAAARPAPNITWLYQDIGITEDNFSKIEDDLFITKSTLNITTNKSFHNRNIYCSASNHPDDKVNSRNMSFDILYSPKQPPSVQNTITKNGNIYSIIEGKYGTLTCKIPISNPNALLQWKDLNFSREITRNESFVTNKLRWLALRSDKSTFTCVAEHKCNKFSRSISVQIKVLYPPKVNTLSNKSIVEGSPLNITCKVTLGKPEAVTFKWTRRKDTFKIYSNVLMIEHISRNDSSVYNCTATNLMKPTFGTEEIGESIGSMYIDVLYPPTVENIPNITAIEGHNFTLLCPVNEGNPSLTNITWTSANGSVQNKKSLSLRNVSRKHDMTYTCTVVNTMKTTDNTTVIGRNDASFHLEVTYGATVYNFTINDHNHNGTVTLNETQNVTFLCNVDSNPISKTEITSQNGSIIISTNSNDVSHSIGLAKCIDAGMYECSGRNILNSTKRLNLLVNCSPRAHPLFHVKDYISTALNVPVVLSFVAVAYPLPTRVVWEKHINDNWTTFISYNNIPRDLSFSLTFENVNQTDIGKYRLLITNLVGDFEQNFTVIAADNPSLPLDFHVINDKISTSAVTFGWSPSFNGGQSQHFVLNISKKGDQIWTSEEIQDSGENIITFTLKGLSSGTSYKSILYAENSIGRSNVSSTLHFETKEDTKTQRSNILGVIVGVVCGVIFAVSVVFLVIWIFRNRHEKTPGKSIYQNVPFIGKTKSNINNIERTPTSRETNVDEMELQEVDDIPNIQTERTEYYNSLEKISKIDRINVSELFQYVLGKEEDEFAIEYQTIPTELHMPCIFARKPENIALNRYNGIFPYDHSRVKIPTQPDFFMNACYIDGFERRKAYIASLGPTEKTTHKYVSFWEMVWYERTDVIVMLTNLREVSGMKCEQYWPDDGSKTYGDISVSCLKTERFAEYTVRSFILSKDKEQQLVTHLHYTAWPDKTVPEDVTSLLEFRQRMIATPTTSRGPIIIHCSAGIGRTGTLIAIDRLVAEGRNRKSVNVFECVKSMREQRVKMVQTLEQYIFVYKALVTALSFDCEARCPKDFIKSIDEAKNSKYSRQFQQLGKTIEKDKKEEREARNRNEKQTDRNRLGADIPGDRFRVFLYFDVEGDSNYVNAVYVNGFKAKDMFIVGQTPLPSTVRDFIRMTYQENCICIVTMDDFNESEKLIGNYITENSQQQTFGNFKVSSSILETKYFYILREMKIKYEGKHERGEKCVYHFQYTQWLEEKQIPENAGDFVRFVKEVQQYANEFGDETSRILVHCMNANERSGLFCAISIITEKLQLEDRASVTNTVRRLRTRRRSAITSKEQLLFCYQAGGAFIQLQER